MQIVLATEDELSEEVGVRLAADVGVGVCQRLRRGGSGYLQSRMKNFCEIASFQPVLVLADLDQARCPSELVAKWFGTLSRPPSLLLRFAVREIESWLLADHVGIGNLLGRRVRRRLPKTPDELRDPKRVLLSLAEQAPRDVRSDLLPPEGAFAVQGLGYNSRLCEFVRNAWDPRRAAERSPSLRKARNRLGEMVRAARRRR